MMDDFDPNNLDQPARKKWRPVREVKARFGDEDFIPASDVPFDIELRKPHPLRRLYDRFRPLKYIVKLDFRYNREFMSDFMPVGESSFVGQGSYKRVYRLPWDHVVKLGRHILPSDPYYGSQYQQIAKAPHKYLTIRERQLMEYLTSQYFLQRNRRNIERKFYRLALERLHYETIRKTVPDLVVPTEFFMGVRFREMFFSKKSVPLTMPCDIQPVLHGKHLKEFAAGATPAPQSTVGRYLWPKWNVVFSSKRFGKVKRKTLLKLRKDLERVVKLCEELAGRHKLILDLHSENLIITLPDFQIRLFDFHLFDTHLYEPELRGLTPEKEHIEMIETFINSFGLEQ